MAEPFDLPAWIALFTGLYALAAAVGELRAPGRWWAMMEDLANSAALTFLTGILCLALGALIYLASPWRPGDWLSVAVSVLGGLMVAEGLVLLAAPDRLLGFAQGLIARTARLWAGLAALIGVALVLAGLTRL